MLTSFRNLLRTNDCSALPGFFSGTMASADFLRFVVTAHFFPLRPQDLPGYSHILSLFTCRIYRKQFRVAIGLCFDLQTHPRSQPYMRFLFVRPEICPLGDLLTPKIRLSLDSASRRTPLPLARPSRYRAASGLSPYRMCAHRAHKQNKQAPQKGACLFWWT